MISTQVARSVYTGDGVTTGFPFSAVVLNSTDVVVLEVVIATGVSTTLTLGGHYSIEGTPDSVGRYTNGITVRAAVAPASTVQWVIYQDPAVTQNVDLTDNGLLPVESQIELPLDRLTVINQRTRNLVTRVLRQPDSDSTTIGALPNKVERASKFLAFDAAGNPIASDGGISGSVTTSTFMQTVLDDADAAAARATLKVGCSLGSVRGLVGERNVLTSTIIDLSADEITLVKHNISNQPSEYVTIRNTAGLLSLLSVNAATAGPVAGGRDQSGAFTNPSAIGIWAIYNGSTVALIATANGGTNFPALPSGYTHVAYLTTVMFTTSFVDVRIVGNTVYCTGAVASALTATSATFVNLTTFASAIVPSAASAILGDVALSGTSTAGGLLDMTFILSSGTSTNPVTVHQFRLFQSGINSTSQAITAPFRLALWSLGFVYSITVTTGTGQSATVTVRGYEVLNGDQ